MIETEHLDVSKPIRDGMITYSLPMTLVRIAVVQYSLDKSYGIADFPGSTGCPSSTICSEVLTVPDPRHSYLVRFRGNPFFDDDLTVQVDSNGYLNEETKGIATDQTGAILVSAIRTAVGDVPRPEAFSDRGTPELVERILFDPNNPEMLAGINRKLRQRDLSVSCEGACESAAPPVVDQAEELYYRHPRTIFLTVRNRQQELLSVHPLASFNGSPLIAQRVERTAFVTKRTTGYTYEKGMIKKSQHQKPSEALGLVTTVGNVAGAIIFAPVNALVSQTSAMSNQSSYIAAREKLIEQQASALQAAATTNAAANRGFTDTRIPPVAAVPAADVTSAGSSFSDRRTSPQGGNVDPAQVPGAVPPPNPTDAGRPRTTPDNPAPANR